MLTALGIFLAYCVLCYATFGRWLWKHPGPGGLGALGIPFAPLFPPMMALMLIQGLFRRLLGIKS